MNSSYNYYKDESEKEIYISAMRRYFDEKQEMDKKLESFITPILKVGNLKILDACCGIGHLSYFLSEINNSNTFLGIDQTAYLIEEARKLNANKSNISFELEDIYDLEQKYDKFFDLSIIWKALSWLPYYEDAVKILFNITKKHIFLSSLFYDGDIDFEIKVRDYTTKSGKDGVHLFYNVYSYPKFERYIKKLGCKNIHSWDFEIPIDLPKSNVKQMGTFTMKLENGKRIQVSGAVIMSWKIVQIDL